MAAGVLMDPLTNLYERLRAQAQSGSVPAEPPSFEDWLKYWNDDESEPANLRNYQHWLSRTLSRQRPQKA